MKPSLVGALVILVTACGSRADDAKKPTLRWHGQSFFVLETSQGTRVVFDPHAIDAYGRNVVKGDLVLISHLHNDHTQVDAVDNPKKKVINGLTANGRKTDWNAVDEKFRDVHIRSVATYHDNSQGLEKGKNAVFIVEADGLRFVHLGDLGHALTDEQVKRIGPVDVLMIPVGGVYTLNGTEAKKVVEQLKPRLYIIPMHYGTPVFDDLLPVTEFLEDQPADDIKRFPRTNQLAIDAASKPPRPVIAILNWK
jgi:L-ascorbate metabolism protein UlaG (beta-lactamase superfamily)